MFLQCPLQEQVYLFLRQDFSCEPSAPELGSVLPVEFTEAPLSWDQWSVQHVIIKSASQVLTKLLHWFICPAEGHWCRHLSSSSEVYHYMHPAHPAWADIRPHAAATILLCHKQLPAPSVFLCHSPKILPLDSVTVCRETKFPSQMYLWNHIYFMTIGAPSYLSKPISPWRTEATSPLVSGLQTSFLAGFMISAFLLPEPFLTGNAVPNRMLFPGLSPLSLPWAAMQRRVSWGDQSFTMPMSDSMLTR